MTNARVELLESRRLLASSSLDLSFGDQGSTIVDIGAQSKNFAAAVQADGKLLIAGQQGSNAYLARLNVNGTLDAGFGDNGIAKFDLGNNESFNAIAVLDTGKILVAGQGAKGTRHRGFLVRYNANGQVDTGTKFGQGDGIEMLATNESIQSMTVSGSKLFAVGDHLSRRNIGSGTLDTGFATTGQIDVGAVAGITGFSAADIAVSTVGKIAVTGTGTSTDSGEGKVTQPDGPNAAAGNCVIVFTSAGQTDNTFDANGVLFYGGADGQALAYAADGSIFVASFKLVQADSGLPGVFHVTSGGVSTFTQSPTAYPPEAVGVLSGGKVMVVGDQSASRFNANGSVDTTFGAGGTATTANLTTFPPGTSPYGVFADDGGAAVAADGSSFAVNFFNRSSDNSTGPIIVGKFLANPPV